MPVDKTETKAVAWVERYLCYWVKPYNSITQEPNNPIAHKGLHYNYFQNSFFDQKVTKFLGQVILNHVLMKMRIVSGSHQIGPMGEMRNRVQHDSLF